MRDLFKDVLMTFKALVMSPSDWHHDRDVTNCFAEAYDSSIIVSF